jgi:hypothetical protein
MRHVIRNVIGDLVLVMRHVMHHVMRDVIDHVAQSWGLSTPREKGILTQDWSGTRSSGMNDCRLVLRVHAATSRKLLVLEELLLPNLLVHLPTIVWKWLLFLVSLCA